MKILFITSLAIELNTSAMIGNISLINGFVENGCEVTVVCSNNIIDSKFNNEIPFDLNENVTIKRIGKRNILINMSNNSIRKKNMSLISFLKKIYRRFSLFGSSTQIIKDFNDLKLDDEFYDVIFSTSDPKSSHILAKKIIGNKVKYKKWVQYWGDPIAIDITDTTFLPLWYKKIVEYNILKLSDRIIYVSPFTLEEQKKIYSNISNKMFFSPIAYNKPLEYESAYSDKITLGYFGNYNSSVRNILPLYNAVKNDKRFNLIIAGDSELELKNCDNITVYPRIKQDQVTNLEKQCHILVCVMNKRGTQIPAKPNYYAASNKDILIVLDGNEKKVKEYYYKFNRFQFCNNNDKSIKNQLENYINFDFGKQSPCELLSGKNITYDIINNIISN